MVILRRARDPQTEIQAPLHFHPLRPGHLPRRPGPGRRPLPPVRSVAPARRDRGPGPAHPQNLRLRPFRHGGAVALHPDQRRLFAGRRRAPGPGSGAAGVARAGPGRRPDHPGRVPAGAEPGECPGLAGAQRPIRGLGLGAESAGAVVARGLDRVLLRRHRGGSVRDEDRRGADQLRGEPGAVLAGVVERTLGVGSPVGRGGPPKRARRRPPASTTPGCAISPGSARGPISSRWCGARTRARCSPATGW